MILIQKSAGLVNERGSFLLNPRPEASEPAVRRAVHFAGNLRALRDPKPRFPDSVWLAHLTRPLRTADRYAAQRPRSAKRAARSGKRPGRASRPETERASCRNGSPPT